MMAAPWPNSSLKETLWFVMYMGSKISSNLSTHCLTTFTSIATWQPLSQMVKSMKSPRRLLIFSTPFSSQYESESYHQHQNKSENNYGVIKCYINTIMNLSAPWHDLCMSFASCHCISCSWWHHPPLAPHGISA